MLQPYYTDSELEAGVDEAGRGCLAGPVCAAAVILPRDFYHPLLNDSKKLSEKTRELLRPVIEREAVSYAVAMCAVDEIDNINILNATFRAMHSAISSLRVRPEILLIDGNRFPPYPFTVSHCIVKGDAKFASIAAASVLAKTYRDEYMQKIDMEFPEYGWARNKGYPTMGHRLKCSEIGISPYHRKSFKWSLQK